MLSMKCVCVYVWTHTLLFVLHRKAHFPTLTASLLWASPLLETGPKEPSFLSVSWPGSVLSCSVLNWTLTGCQQARGCMLPASAFQEARVFVQGVSKCLEMFNTILQRVNGSIGNRVWVCWLANASYVTEDMSDVYYCGTD